MKGHASRNAMITDHLNRTPFIEFTASHGKPVYINARAIVKFAEKEAVSDVIQAIVAAYCHSAAPIQ